MRSLTPTPKTPAATARATGARAAGTGPARRIAWPFRLTSLSWPCLLVVTFTLWCAALALGRGLLRVAGASGPLVDTLAQVYAPAMRVLLTLDAAAGLLLVVSLGAIAVHVGQAAARNLR